MSDGPEWFAPKRYGYGAGMPIAWQGWALTIGFILLIILAARLLPFSWIGYFSIVVTLALLFTLIAARTTRGGWRWRWGDPD
ncbi:MAG: hypothetical protein ABI422_04810 [Sphingomicrobium sp.]